MGKWEVELSSEEEKALLVDMVSIQMWLDNAIHNKARRCIDRIVTEHSDKQPQKVTQAEKRIIVQQAVVETALERTKRMEGKLLEES